MQCQLVPTDRTRAGLFRGKTTTEYEYICSNPGCNRVVWSKDPAERTHVTCHSNDPNTPISTPGTNPLELGDAVKTALSSVGITEERVSDWIGGPCGCPERIERLNELSRWAKRVLAGKTHKAKNYIETLLRNGEPMRWSYGVTTVPQRRHELLPRTLKSLAAAGFNRPHLFVDGCLDSYEGFERYDKTIHSRTLRTFGTWVTALWELYARVPDADRYAIFQDDFVTYRNLRQYLDQCEYPERGYWNLYTVNQNTVINDDENQGRQGWFRSNQKGRGAVALVFNRDAVTTLLGQSAILARPQDRRRGWMAVDGAISDAFRNERYIEYVHHPSLVQHTGDQHSSMSKRTSKAYRLAPHFNGEDFDALELLNETSNSTDG